MQHGSWALRGENWKVLRKPRTSFRCILVAKVSHGTVCIQETQVPHLNMRSGMCTGGGEGCWGHLWRLDAIVPLSFVSIFHSQNELYRPLLLKCQCTHNPLETALKSSSDSVNLSYPKKPRFNKFQVTADASGSKITLRVIKKILFIYLRR